MLIWIVDDDIAFSYDLKQKILESPVMAPDRDDLRIDVFHAPAPLEKTVQEPKRRVPLPDLVFLDVMFPGETGLDAYLLLHRGGSPLVDKIVFCSSISYARFEAFFRKHGLPTPPFMQKLQVEKQLDRFLCLPDQQEKKETPTWQSSLPPPLRLKAVGELKEALKLLKDQYYRDGVFQEGVAAFVPHLVTILDKAHRLGWTELVLATQEMSAFLERKKLTPMRLKRELHDYLETVDRLVNLLKS